MEVIFVYYVYYRYYGYYVYFFSITLNGLNEMSLCYEPIDYEKQYF